MIGKIVDNLDAVMAGGDNKKRKHLLNLLVKKVLIHDRRTIEVWYSIPNSPAYTRQANCKPDGERFETWDIWLPELDTKLTPKTTIIQLLVRMYKYRTRHVRIVLGEPLPKEPPLPKPVPKNIIAEALKVRTFFTDDPMRTFHHASQHFKVSKARISQLMKIVSVLPEDFVEYMRHRQDEDIIRKFSGKTLLRIAGLESSQERQEAISELMGEFELTV
jgi:hypothetical protein